MKKRLSFLFMILLVLVLAACGGGNSQPSGTSTESPKKEESDAGKEAASGEFEKMTIALGHSTADNDTSHYHQGSLKFKELVEEATGGNVTIEIHANGSLGGEREMTEAVQIGTLDMVLTSSGPVGNFAPKSNAFDFPFLFRDKEHAYAVLDGELGDEVSAQLEEVGIKVLAWAENGFRNMTNSKHPIVNPEDIKGMKIRTMENQVHLSAFEAYGAAPTPMAFTELFSAMQQGVVDGQENPLAVIMPNKFPEVQGYLTLSEHIYSPAPLLISKAKFDSFSPELQEVFLEAAAEMRDWERNFCTEMDEQFIQTALDEGMEIVKQDEFNYDAFFEATQSVYEQYKNEYGEFHEKILAVQ
ncbi:DctP family TRAP transporter solute-binding subunit [bacterium LRH843]|nr:DctP family TRAP transporter solute-binding subunit [bacterium LRH843]